MPPVRNNLKFITAGGIIPSAAFLISALIFAVISVIIGKVLYADRGELIMMHVTFMRTDNLTPKTYQQIYERLSPYRREKVDCYFRQNDKYLSASAGFLFKRALKKYGIDDCEVIVSRGDKGKPYIRGAGVYFNLSHSGSIAVCAAGRESVGIDVQQIKYEDEKLLRCVCTEKECERLLALDEDERARQFCRMWAVKESVMKFYGMGFFLPAKTLEVEFGTPIVVKRDGKPEKLFIKEYELEGYCLAACARRDCFAPKLQEIVIKFLR